jgi:hypothetical protein
MQILDNPQKIVDPLNDTLRSHQLSRPEAMFLQYVTNKEKEDEDKDEDSDEEDNVLLSDQLSNYAEECLEEKMKSEVEKSVQSICSFCDWYVDCLSVLFRFCSHFRVWKARI